jgi:2-polyprenyl-6-methoxyphenol hydroxylase-like FAD-dependent oxidoreductase
VKVLIVGAGVSGLTLAWCLHQTGHDVTVVERRPNLREDGCLIGFFGIGYDTSEKLGLIARLEAIHRPIARLRVAGADGEPRVSVSYEAIRSRLFRDRHVNVMRGDLIRMLYDRVNGRVDVRFATGPVWIERHARKTVVRLTDDTVVEADLLVGADGVHSVVRQLTFGPESDFTRAVGYTAAAFILTNPPDVVDPGRDLITFTLPDRQVTICPVDAGRVEAFFLHRSSVPYEGLQGVYGNAGGCIIPALLSACEHATVASFRQLEQIRMRRWSRDRVVLVGDACHSASPLVRQGASMAMASAYVLSEELKLDCDVWAALLRYQMRVQPLVLRQQQTAARIARWFVPSTRLGILLRDTTIRAAAWPSLGVVLRQRVSARSVV